MDKMKSEEVMSMTPQKPEVPVQYQTPPQPEPVVTKPEPVVAPPAPVVTPTPEPMPTPVPERRELPHTASTLALVMFVGAGLLALGFALRGLTHSKVTR
jgi:hypothetical protein